ncbi:helix-turn-helix domain-containing protein [Arenibacter palladensis]|uniref:helix-turn-helix domain-containing protein n=1 Tax=Arenibacter palladensis TaxID=237373 RepID=UPI0026E21143|nr:helix-turn-helix transcriptional regulator [Arenibacter palladensis]MDO6602108.1 helix-turn-helix transcriptional regulator [Arenibacter palladensis]
MDSKILLKLVGSRIKELRENNNLSQLQLANEVDLSKTHLGRIERAESNVTVETLNRIAVFFNVPITFFFEIEKRA